MKTAKVNYLGIERNMSSQTVQNGGLDELINFRHYNGRLTPSGNPTNVYNLPEGTFTAIWHHEQDGIDNYIGLEQGTNNLKLINLGTGASTLIKSYVGSVQVEFLKRFMIVIHDSGMDIFLYQNNEYRLIIMPGRPMLFYSAFDKKVVSTENATGANAVLGKYYKALNEENKKDGFLTGGIMFRAAYRMYDGSYVLHSLPEYLNLGLEMHMTELKVDGEGEDNDPNSIVFGMSRINVAFNKMNYLNVDKNIFTHVCIFACKNEELYDISEDTITDEVILEKVKQVDNAPMFSVDFNDILDGDISEDYKNLADSPSWYLVHEIEMEEILNSDAYTLQEIDTKDFYQDYATRETLTVDNFSHHQLNGSYSYNYISRLTVSDLTTIFGSYNYFPLNPAMLVADSLFFPDNYVDNGTRNCKLVVTLNTSSGDVTKIIDAGERPVADYGGKTWIVLSKDVVGYPDARAKKIEILLQNNGSWYNIGSIKLTKSKYGNYSYYHSDSFSSAPDDISSYYTNNFNRIFIGSDFPAAQVVNINDFTDTEFNDENIVKISEVNNPFVFNSENTYEVGTGRVLAVATNTEPLGSGQYGEHPIIVFTTKGRYALYQGPDDILFKNVKPLDGDVPGETTSITSVATGVVYTTAEGLYIAYGKDVTDLSTSLYGRPNIDLQNNNSFTGRLNHNQLVQISGSLSTVDAKMYIQGALIGFNKIFKELLVTNNDYGYSYVYSFESKTWRKISQSYDLLIDSYPKLLCVRSNSANNGVFDLSQENFLNDVQGLIVTRPIRFSDDIDLTQLYEAVQRCEIETTAACYAGFYCFGSNDLVNWELLGGNDRKTGKIDGIKRGRTHLPVQYLVFVFASTMKEYSAVNVLSMAYELKMNKRLRV